MGQSKTSNGILQWRSQAKDFCLGSSEESFWKLLEQDFLQPRIEIASAIQKTLLHQLIIIHYLEVIMPRLHPVTYESFSSSIVESLPDYLTGTSIFEGLS